jgi:hypothetical protein
LHIACAAIVGVGSAYSLERSGTGLGDTAAVGTADVAGDDAGGGVHAPAPQTQATRNLETLFVGTLENYNFRAEESNDFEIRISSSPVATESARYRAGRAPLPTRYWRWRSDRSTSRAPECSETDFPRNAMPKLQLAPCWDA